MTWKNLDGIEKIECIEDARLARIENKLDEVGSAIIAMARIEEKMITLFRRMDNYDAAQSSATERLSKIEMHVGTNGQMLRFAERVFWIVVTAGVGFLFYMARGGS